MGNTSPAQGGIVFPEVKSILALTQTNIRKKKNRQKNWWPRYIIERSIFVFVVPTVNIKTGYIVLGAIIMQL